MKLKEEYLRIVIIIIIAKSIWFIIIALRKSSISKSLGKRGRKDSKIPRIKILGASKF